ncbi:hypothetical protein V5T82_05710 [Magnetovibrio sp. PR-2]|uniref:hypothetical protein n=1 Tax=Magnetovibrio sp. PR-2 TaxID=3120356 RepID=UPI002FCE5494
MSAAQNPVSNLISAELSQAQKTVSGFELLAEVLCGFQTIDKWYGTWEYAVREGRLEVQMDNCTMTARSEALTPTIDMSPVTSVKVASKKGGKKNKSAEVTGELSKEKSKKTKKASGKVAMSGETNHEDGLDKTYEIIDYHIKPFGPLAQPKWSIYALDHENHLEGKVIANSLGTVELNEGAWRLSLSFSYWTKDIQFTKESWPDSLSANKRKFLRLLLLGKGRQNIELARIGQDAQ